MFCKNQKITPCAVHQKIEDNFNRLLTSKIEHSESEKQIVIKEIIEDFYCSVELAEQINEERKNWKLTLEPPKGVKMTPARIITVDSNQNFLHKIC